MRKWCLIYRHRYKQVKEGGGGSTKDPSDLLKFFIMISSSYKQLLSKIKFHIVKSLI